MRVIWTTASVALALTPAGARNRRTRHRHVGRCPTALSTRPNAFSVAVRTGELLTRERRNHREVPLHTPGSGRSGVEGSGESFVDSQPAIGASPSNNVTVESLGSPTSNGSSTKKLNRTGSPTADADTVSRFTVILARLAPLSLSYSAAIVATGADALGQSSDHVPARVADAALHDADGSRPAMRRNLPRPAVYVLAALSLADRSVVARDRPTSR